MSRTAQPAARARLEPILDRDLDRACSFYHTHLNDKISVADWKAAFIQPWMKNKPDNGFMLVDGDRVVGTFGAIHAEREIDGAVYHFINHTSWSVLPDYRRQSLELLSALLGHKGCHVTSFTPNPDVVEICQYMGFTLLDPATCIAPNLPRPFNKRGAVVTGPDEAMRRLPSAAARDFANHLPFPWLEQLALGRDESGWCHLIIKPTVWKKLSSAAVLHLSDAEVFLEHAPALGDYLLRDRGFVTTQMPRRFLPRRPKRAWTVQDGQPRLAISPDLDPGRLTALYTEMLALDLPL